MAKAIASATAASDMATGQEVSGVAIGDAIDKIPEGQSAAITDNSPVQGEVNITGVVRDTFEMPVKNKDGDTVSTVFVTRL